MKPCVLQTADHRHAGGADKIDSCSGDASADWGVHSGPSAAYISAACSQIKTMDMARVLLTAPCLSVLFYGWRRVGVWRLRGRLAPPGSSGPRLRWGRAPIPPRAGSALPSLAASGRHRARRARGPAPWAALVRIRYVLPHPRGLCAVWSPPFVSKISPPSHSAPRSTMVCRGRRWTHSRSAISAISAFTAVSPSD